jgi:hypothetical protein
VTRHPLLALLLLCACWCASPAAEPDPAPASPPEPLPIPETFAQASAGATRPVGDKWFAGGGIGLSFGTVDFIEVVPVVGYRFSPRFAAGLQLLYRYRKDGRYAQEVSTTDYGATLFGRFFVGGGAFLEGDVEYLSFEFIRSNLTTERRNETNFLAGVGLSRPIGKHTSFFIVALYNLTFDDQVSAYEEPWLIRAGVTVGF